MKLKADMNELKEVIARQNTLESYVHKIFDKKPKKERDITQEMIDRDDEEEDYRRDDDEINLGENDGFHKKSKK